MEPKSNFLTATPEDLDNLPPLPNEEESELRKIAHALFLRAQEDYEKELLQKKQKESIVISPEQK
jgi:hypothetical protein